MQKAAKSLQTLHQRSRLSTRTREASTNPAPPRLSQVIDLALSKAHHTEHTRFFLRASTPHSTGTGRHVASLTPQTNQRGCRACLHAHTNPRRGRPCPCALRAPGLAGRGAAASRRHTCGGCPPRPAQREAYAPPTALGVTRRGTKADKAAPRRPKKPQPALTIATRRSPPLPSNLHRLPARPAPTAPALRKLARTPQSRRRRGERLLW